MTPTVVPGAAVLGEIDVRLAGGFTFTVVWLLLNAGDAEAIEIK